MDLNREYAEHQQALIRAGESDDLADRQAFLVQASDIAGRISAFQHKLGAAAACAWSMAQSAAANRI
jgi:hypothetical protein